MAAAGKFAVVFGDGIPIAGGDLSRVGVADRAAAVFIELAAQLQFQRVHAADQLLMHLFDQGGIAGEALGVQTAHLLDQRLQRLPRLWIILHCGTNLVQKVQSLVNLALRIGRVGTLLGRCGLTGNASIAGILAAIYVPVAPATARIAYRTCDAVADRTRLASVRPGLTGLLAARLTTLTSLTALTRLALLLAGLTALTGLPIAAELALPALAGLALTILLTLVLADLGQVGELG